MARPGAAGSGGCHGVPCYGLTNLFRTGRPCRGSVCPAARLEQVTPYHRREDRNRITDAGQHAAGTIPMGYYVLEQSDGDNPA